LAQTPETPSIPSPGTLSPRIHWAWVILAVSFLTVFTSYSIRLSYGILMPEIIGSLQIRKAEAGAVASSFYLVYTVVAPFVGFLADRVSARRLLVCFCLIQGAGTLLMGFPSTLWQACLFFALVGAGSAAMWAPVVTLVQRWFGFKRRGAVLGILSVSYAIGYGLMGLVLPPLVERFGWRFCWVLLALLSFAMAPLNGLFLRTHPRDLGLRPWGEDTPAPEGVGSESLPAKAPYRLLLRLPNLWMGGLAYFFTGFTAYVVNLYIVTYANLELGFPFAQSAGLASFIAFSGIAGALTIPLLSDRLGRRKCLLLLNLGYSAVILLIVWAANSWPILVAAACLYGVIYTATWPMYAAAAADFFPSGTTGSVLGFWTIFFGLGLVLAPAAAGWVADRSGSLAHSFLLAAATGVVAAFFIARIRKREPSPKA
jgi:sugar phosphate permease